MYLETGLGARGRKSVKQWTGGPDRVVVVGGQMIMAWTLNVPFRKDFRAFLQEVEKRIGLHVVEGTGPHKDNTNSELNKQKLKAYHDYALRHVPPLIENLATTTVNAQYSLTQEMDNYRSKVIILDFQP
jgi:hypothetical protein